MELFINAVKAFFDTFSAVVFVPIIMFIINIAFKVKPKKAFISALSAGVGLQGFNLVIGAYSPIIQPIISRMVEATGINLPVYDAGWPNTSVVAYSTQAGMIFIVIAILLQVILFLTKYTTVFQAGDLWNNYSYFCWGSMLFVLTGNMFLAICLMTMQLLITLLITEVIAKRWSTYYGYEGCTIASLHTATIAVIAIPLNWLMDKFGLYKIKMDPESMRKRLGSIGEPMTLGLILGIVIGIAGNITRIGELKAWGEILSCGVATSAVMSVFPKISSIFSGAFTSITEASKKKTKGFKGEWYLAVNDATGYGETATLVSGLLTMPIILILAFVLPGNTTLPMVDLVAIPYCIQPIVAMSNGNVLKSVIGSTIVGVIFLYVCSACGVTFTEVVQVAGGSLGANGAMMVTSFIIIGQPIGYLTFLIFASQNIFLIGLLVAVYAVSYVIIRKNKDKIHDALERQALNPTGKTLEMTS
ncbi:PTS transporter subunit IIC [Clostridium sp. AL.422]|uniref:PTS galactitol transporter subunit IIC n=1 Tax=Clostridium TaxID=1485 RepID=UPI00293DCAF4|nr:MULTISPECIES: PTS transporter subunit IIC [unclassified Clostridium]MDV4149947.1 PTS transporter subunit IIC [Clostridium sp. AL.422]